MKSKLLVVLLVASVVGIVSVPASMATLLEDKTRAIEIEIAAKTPLVTIIKKSITDTGMPLKDGFAALLNAGVNPAIIITTAINDNNLPVGLVIGATIDASVSLGYDPASLVYLVVLAAESTGAKLEEIVVHLKTAGIPDEVIASASSRGEGVFGFTPAPEPFVIATSDGDIGGGGGGGGGGGPGGGCGGGGGEHGSGGNCASDVRP